MSYDKKVAAAARTELERRRVRAEETARNNLDRFLAECPRAEEIRREMAYNSAQAARAVVSGKDVRLQLERRKDRGLSLRREYEELLEKHGLSRRDVEPQYTCPHCKDTGFVEGRMCACYRALRRTEAYRQLSAGLPLDASTFQSFSLDAYRNDPSVLKRMEHNVQVCQNFVQHFPKVSGGLLLWGGTGLGKTHLSLAVANAVLEKGFGVVYGTAQNFAVALERERFSKEEEEDSTAGSLKDCDLLILDDLGTEFSSPYANAALYDVINSRLMAGKATVISTNYGIGELEKRYGDRLTSRVAGEFQMLGFVGSDMRIRKLRESVKKRDRTKNAP